MRPVLFTHNPAFQTLKQLRQRSRSTRFTLTKKRHKRAALLRRAMRRFGVKSCQIVYLPAPGKNFARESKDVVRRYFDLKHASISTSDVIFRDAGHCFTEVCPELLAQQKVGAFIKYPPSIHETLSPNDNKHHGRAKAKWRNSKYYLRGDVWSSLYLLRCLGSDPREMIRRDFNQNFFLHARCNPQKKAVEQILLTGEDKPTQRKLYHQECARKYKIFSSNISVRSLPSSFQNINGIDCRLDGKYWN